MSDQAGLDGQLERAIAIACQMQRWRDWSAHVTAYIVFNIVFLAAWAFSGRGYFWPAWTLLGWGVGISFQHLYAVIRRPISTNDVWPKIAPTPSHS